MGNLFNNPRFIVPFAIFAALFLLYRVVPDPFEAVLTSFSKQPAATPPTSQVKAPVEVSEPLAVEYMGALLRERWLPERWRQFANLQRDPFVASYIEPEEPEMPIFVLQDEAPPPPMPEDLATYIVENIGLDADGFFVRFGQLRIREGEKLGSELVQQIAVPEMRLGVDSLDLVTQHLSGLQIDATAPEADPPSVFIDGNLFREGDLVLRSPVLAVGEVRSDRVSLLDRGGRIWWLYMQE
jgi:hypothetical protein